MKQERHRAVPFLFVVAETGSGPSVLVGAALAAMLLLFVGATSVATLLDSCVALEQKGRD
jgi:hypothetical protein